MDYEIKEASSTLSVHVASTNPALLSETEKEAGWFK